MIIDVDLPAAHDDGHFISGKVSRIVELVREYDSNLDVVWVPPERRGADDPAFAVTERLTNGSTVVAFYVQSEAEFDERVLERIILGDNKNHDVQARMEAKNLAARASAEARAREEREQYYDLMGSMIRSGKSTYRHDGRKYAL
jgi:hypothetical protein